MLIVLTKPVRAYLKGTWRTTRDRLCAAQNQSCSKCLLRISLQATLKHKRPHPTPAFALPPLVPMGTFFHLDEHSSSLVNVSSALLCCPR